MKELILLGTHPRTAGLCPTGVEVWTVPFMIDRDATQHLNITKCFEIHRRDEYILDTVGMIEKTEVPVVLQEPNPNVKNQELYPYEAIFAKYGKYFTNSISLMLVHAVELGYDRIGIYGVEFENDREYTIERPNIEYWAGYFRAKGVDIYSPAESCLFKSHYVYGIDNILHHIKRQNERIEELEDAYIAKRSKFTLEKDETKREAMFEEMNGILYCKFEAEFALRSI